MFYLLLTKKKKNVKRMKKRIVSLMALLLSFVSVHLFAQQLTSVAPNGTFTADDIEYWVGAGDNEVGLIIHYNRPSMGDDCFVLGYRCGDNVSLQDALIEISTVDSRFKMEYTGGFLDDFAFDYDEDGIYEYSALNDMVAHYFMLRKDCSLTATGMSGVVMEGNHWMSIALDDWDDVSCLVQNATYTPVPTIGGSSDNSCDITSLPYVENFDTYGISGSGTYTFPTCWTKISTGNTPNISSTNHNGGGGLYMQVADNAQVVAVFPKLADTIAINTLSLNFWGKVNTLGKRIVLGVMTDKNDISTFDTVWATTPTSKPWQEYTVDLSQYTGSGKYIAFMAKGWSDVGNVYYVDDIELMKTPVIDAPAMTDENIVAWAKGVETSVTTGSYFNAIGQANTTKFVALQNGTATLTFDRPIKNESGADFLIFANESGSQGQAFVEVSSDGVNFFRFNAKTSVLQTGYGTAYDLDSLSDNDSLDKNNIRLIRLVGDGNFNLAGIGVYNAGEQYSIADFENMLDTPDTYEIVGDSTPGATLVGQDEYGMDMYSKDYTNCGLVFNGLALYGGSFAIGWGPSNLTTNSGYYATSAGAAVEGVGNGYLQGYFSDYAGTTEHLTVVADNNSTFNPQGTYICQSAASYSDDQSMATNDNNPGWMRIVAKGYNQNGDSVASAFLYLVDKSTGGVGNVKEWRWLDMSAFGEVAKVRFFMESNYANDFGLMITSYFCMDNFVYTIGSEIPCTPITETITETLCYGETFSFNGQTYNATGTYTTTVAGQNDDCDTLYTINLTILPQNTPINDEVTISQSELPYSYHGQTYSDFGSYTLTTQDENGCDQVYNLTLVDNSGISEVEGGLMISLYPNPTDNNATLRVKGLSEQATIIITDQQGRVVSSKVLAQGVETLEIETTNLASGVYYIRIQTANTIKTEKLIKK